MKLKRILVLSAGAGFIVAVSLAWLFTGGLGDSSVARLLSNIGGYLWPSAILMMDVDELSLDTLPLLLLSATINALIYSFIACSAYTVWRFFAGPKDDGWWPSK